MPMLPTVVASGTLEMVKAGFGSEQCLLRGENEDLQDVEVAFSRKTETLCGRGAFQSMDISCKVAGS